MGFAAPHQQTVSPLMKSVSESKMDHRVSRIFSSFLSLNPLGTVLTNRPFDLSKATRNSGFLSSQTCHGEGDENSE